MGEFGEDFHETVTLERAGGSDNHYSGGDGFADPIEIKARVDHAHRQTTTADGTVVVSGTQIFTEAVIDEGDRIVLAHGPGVTHTHFVIEAQRHTDLEGDFSHYEALLR